MNAINDKLQDFLANKFANNNQIPEEITIEENTIN